MEQGLLSRRVAEKLVDNADFISDITAIKGLSESEFESLASALASHVGFCDRTALERLIGERIADKNRGSRLAGSILRLAKLFYDLKDDAPGVAAELPSLTAAKLGGAADEVQPLLKRRIGSLANGFACLSRQFKSESLIHATGNQLDAAQIFCDIRPVFDATRKKVEGAVQISLLRLEYTSAEGERRVLEVNATPQQLKSLQEAAAAAVGKGEAISELLSSAGVRVAPRGENE
ncbi:MAG: hypothetical protein ACP5O1_07905 [Phycisphaerae bacterium]